MFLSSLLPVKFLATFTNFASFARDNVSTKRYKHKVKLVMFFTLSLLALLNVHTFFVDTLSRAKLAKIGESS